MNNLNPERYAWATVLVRLHQDLVEQWLSAERATPYGNGEHLELREKIRDLFTIVCANGRTYTMGDSIRTNRDWSFVSKYVREARDNMVNVRYVAYGHYRVICKWIDAEFSRTDQRRSYKRIAESLCARSADQGSTDLLMATKSIQKFIESRYSFDVPDRRTIKRFLEWLTHRGFGAHKMGIRMDKESCTSVRLFMDPFDSATVNDTEEWLWLTRDALDDMYDREAHARDEKDNGPILRHMDEFAYVDDRGQHRVSWGKEIPTSKGALVTSEVGNLRNLGVDKTPGLVSTYSQYTSVDVIWEGVYPPPSSEQLKYSNTRR